MDAISSHRTGKLFLIERKAACVAGAFYVNLLFVLEFENCLLHVAGGLMFKLLLWRSIQLQL